ncbi:hypothetical protein [Treponema sp.]|uniref:hypothetical protein n=1 Tax=Treponema sp. TaxID=166 RepID=UPI003890D098
MRKLLFLFLYFFTFSHIFAGFNDGAVSKFVEFDITSTTTRGLERYNTLYSVQTGLSGFWAEGLFGFQNYEDCFDFSARAQVWFPFTSWIFETSRIALGCGGFYHFQRYKDISSEHDYIFNTTFRYQSKKGTTISFFGGYGGKATKLDALADFVPVIYDDYPEAGMLIDKIWESGFEIYFEHALNYLYRYPVFCTPHYLLGAAVNLDSGLRFSGDVSMQVADGYAASPYVNSLLLKFGVMYTF